MPGLVEAPGGAQAIEAFENFDIDNRPQSQTYLVRGTVDDANLDATHTAALATPNVVGMFADVSIQSIITCGGSPAVGNSNDVANMLNVPFLKSHHMDGANVAVAVVDTGINIAYLNGKGLHPKFDPVRSWSPQPADVPGSLPVAHGTMCAFDVCIASPNCTFIDMAVLRSTTPGHTVMEGLLSDAVKAYSKLVSIMGHDVGAGRKFRALVVSNSWGMFHPSWDFPVGNPGNYSDNPKHPFNVIVGALERAGADILFAAGNCGRECPDGRCQGLVGGIYGANSHPQVLSIGGVDTHQDRVGYSTSGPGHLFRGKPDVCGYTHFDGSKVFSPSPDSGTSAATPVVAGLVAAVRTRRPWIPGVTAASPESLRKHLRKTAIDKGPHGFDFDYGYGIVDGEKFARSLLAVHATFDDEIPVEANESSLTIPPDTTNAIGLRTFFSRITPDAGSGDNVLTVNGLPAGTRVVSAWMTEWILPNNPHAGSAVFSTTSVQLFDDGRQCRIHFYSSWSSSLPAAVQMIFGS